RQPGAGARAVRPAGGRRAGRAPPRRAGGGPRPPPPPRTLMRIGTRRSPLAMAQADEVARMIGDAELVPIATRGDRSADGSDKSRWVAELEQALLEGRVDIAVHSAKDVPGDLAPGLDLVAAPARAAAEDVLCGAAGLDALPAGARVGTSSLRRMAQLRAAREDIELGTLRGNVDTRP